MQPDPVEKFRQEAQDAVEKLRQVNSELEIERREKQLIHKIASASNLNNVFSELMHYMQDNWGFDAFQVQLVDECRRQLVFYKYYGINLEDMKTREAITVPIPLDHSASVSAHVAMTRRRFYADHSQLEHSEMHSQIDRDAVKALGIKENLILPIVEEGHSIAIGVIHLFAMKERLGLSREKIDEINQFIDSIAPHIITEKRKQELEILRVEHESTIRLVRQISTTIELEPLLSIMGHEIMKRKEFDGYLVALADRNEENLVCEQLKLPGEYFGIERTYLKFQYPLISNDVLATCFRTGQKAYYDWGNIDEYADTTRHLFMAWKLQSMMVFPIVCRDSRLGSIALLKQKGKMTEDSISAIELLLPLFVEQIKNAMFYSRLRAEEREIQNATELNQRFLNFVADVNNLTSVDLIYQLFSEEFLKRFKFDFAAVYIKNQDRLHFMRLTSVDSRHAEAHYKLNQYLETTPYEMDEAEGALVNAVLRNVRIYVPDVQKVKHLPMSKKDREAINILGTNRTVLQVPIRRRNHPVGVVGLFSIEEQVLLSESDLKIIELMCSFMGTAVANAELYATVGQQKEEMEKTLAELKTTQAQLVQTERSRLEAMRAAKDAAEASAKAKSSFLANMSHEIRTPMNAIIGFSELMGNSQLNARQYDYLNKITNSSKQLLGIINDILDLSKIESGKMDMEEIPFCLDDVLDRVADIFASKVVEKPIDIVFHCPQTVPQGLYGDPLRLGQVLINLINNAVKFTECGEVVVVVDVLETLYNSVVLEFKVKDSGIGIPEDKIDSLFDSFTQADQSTTRKFGGSGLGLSICRHLVEMMGGHIEANSEHGRGSVFEFTVHLKLGPDSVARTVLPDMMLGRKALVVDDNHEMNRTLVSQLQEFGLKASWAEDAESALSVISQAIKNGVPFEVILIDWKLPGMSGFELIRQLHDAYPSRTGIVFMTGFGNDDEITMARQMGVKSILMKPVKISLISDAIMAAFSDDYVSLKQQGHIKETPISIQYQHLKGTKALVIDDSSINQEVVIDLLEMGGVEAVAADNGQEGLNRLERENFDVVLTDLQMPVMDGYEFVKQLRKNSRFGDVPVIAMTADAMAEDKERCLSAGMDDYVSKPIESEKVFNAIGRWLKRRSQKSVVKEKEVSGAQSDTSQSEMPERLPGLDIMEAVKRLSGNERLFQKALVEFCLQYRNVADEIVVYLTNNDFESAKVLAHTVKGLASTLGAVTLLKTSTALESMIISREADFLELQIERMRDNLSFIVPVPALLVDEKSPLYQKIDIRREETIRYIIKALKITISEKDRNTMFLCRHLKNINETDLRSLGLLDEILEYMQQDNWDMVSECFGKVEKQIETELT